jgi:hypothetical protein
MLGRTHGARYGLHRQVGTAGSQWPLYMITPEGTAEQIAVVHAIEREHYYVEGGPPRIAGLFDHIPYYLQDARPAGFLGRAIPAAHKDLGLPARVVDWTDVHFVSFLTARGSDNVGNLILGTEALDRHLSDTHGPQIVTLEERPTIYPSLAQRAMLGAPPGSSAQGEHPKFIIRLADTQSIKHALVKFSPSRTSPVGQRWADLLITEHLAAHLLNEQGIAAVRSQIHEFANQVFLETERFDRIAAEGRLGVASLLPIDLERYGNIDSWAAAARRLENEDLLSASDAETVVLLDAFGALIANTDRHFGNITLFDQYEGPFALAPIYDMLPMNFAPQSEQIVERSFELPGPTAATLSVWPRAHELAQLYWSRVSGDARISHEFQGIATQCLASLRAQPRRVRRTSNV